MADMADSDGDTMPFTPEDMTDLTAEGSSDGVFAWVRPQSPSACVAFDAVVNGAIKFPDKYEHTRRFLHVDLPRAVRESSVYTEDSTTGNTGAPQWQGAFKLSLDILPRNPQEGWLLGSSCEMADILLIPSSRRWVSANRVAGRHARLFFHSESCQLVLEARHTVTTTKNNIEVLRGSSRRALGHGELFTLNDCTYTLELADSFASPGFEEELSVFMKRQHGSQWFMNKLLSPSSTGKPLIIGNYYCSPSAFAQGTFGKVSAGWNREGSAVAIKVFKKPNESEIRSHQAIMQYIGQHTNVVQLLDCVYNFETAVPDAYSVYTPLASAALSNLLGSYDFDLKAKWALVTDYLSGLSFLNDEKQVMHRDINPNNLAVTSLDRPKGVILDLDAATADESSTDHMRGTLSYLAPEIIDLKYPSPGQTPIPYRKSVDVWALGLSAYAIYTGHRFRWAYFEAPGAAPRPDFLKKNLYNEFHRILRVKKGEAQSPSERSMLIVIELMTQYAEATRITASEALEAAQSAKGAEGDRGTIAKKALSKRRFEDL